MGSGGGSPNGKITRASLQERGAHPSHRRLSVNGWCVPGFSSLAVRGSPRSYLQWVSHEAMNTPVLVLVLVNVKVNWMKARIKARLFSRKFSRKADGNAN